METRGRVPGLAAALVIALGALLIGAGVAYLVYAQIARSNLDSLVYAVPASVQEGWLRPQPDAGRPADAVTSGEDGGRFDFASAYPADQTNPKFWARPEWAGTGSYGGVGLPPGFELVSGSDNASPPVDLSAANRITIDAIGLDATVKELEIVDLGDSRAYETPVNVVGHIPGTADPGEAGNGWFFGHLESPIRGEGNVFQKLPEIPALAQQDPVDVILENDDGEFLYRVVATDVVYQDDLALSDSDGSTITLVACVPSRVYDHRLLVTAELIARRS